MTTGGGSRNPGWERDELILTLDLYFREGAVGSSHPEVIALSELLNRLPLHPLRPDPERFRNPNSVALKLANFTAVERPGHGMSRHSRQDREVFKRFSSQRDQVAELAADIRREATRQTEEPLTPEEEEAEAFEGRLRFRRHRVRERDPRLVGRKKRRARDRHGRLACEVCAFDFRQAYGEHGHGFIECHHLISLSAAGETRTRLSDLALVCSNCHRMLRRGHPPPGVEELKAMVAGGSGPA